MQEPAGGNQAEGELKGGHLMPHLVNVCPAPDTMHGLWVPMLSLLFSSYVTQTCYLVL